MLEKVVSLRAPKTLRDAIRSPSTSRRGMLSRAHADGKAIEAVRRLAALARAAAGDPCDERADDEHGHRDAQNGFEQITHRGHRLGHEIIDCGKHYQNDGMRTS